MTNESWKDRVAAVAGIVRRGFPQFLGFELLFRVLGVAIFAPLTAWLTARLIAWSGSGAISNYDLAGFFLSVKGVVTLTVAVSIAFALVFFEFGGLVALAIGIQRGKQVRLPQLFRFLGVSLPRLWRLAFRQFLIYLAYAVPCLAVAGGAYLFFLTKSDIYYYLQAKPPAFWWAASIAGAAGLVFAICAIRLFVGWIYSVPILLFSDVSSAEALRESRRLVAGRRREVVGMLLRWLAAAALLFLALWLIMAVLKLILLGLAGHRVGVVLTMTAVLAVVHFVGAAVVTILAMSSLAVSVTRRFLEDRSDIELPDPLTGEEEDLLRRVAGFLRAGWVMVLIFGALTIFAAVKLVNSAQFNDSAGITAHRGSSITAPENTMAAILLAVEEGADYVEIDVQETRDGTVVLAHDKDLKRVFGIEKGIWEVTYDEIKDLDSGGWFSPKFSDQRISTLAEVIEAVKGRAKLNIELKFSGHEQKLAAEVVRIVQEHDFLDQCVLTSLDYAGLRRAKAADPRIRGGIIVTSSIGDITKLETDLLSVSAGSVSRDLLDRARRKGMEVHVWTVNDIASMNTLIGMGVDNIITDKPKLLGDVIRERGKRSNAEKALYHLADFASRRF